MKRTLLALITTLLLAAAAYAQVGPPPGGPGGPHRAFGHAFGIHSGKLVTGAPYSAEMSDVSVQTLTDGNTIQRTITGHVARDSQGRTYEQITTNGGPLGQRGPATMTFIMDPVAGYAYALNANTKTAMRHAIKAPPAGANEWARRGNEHSDANRVENDLGTQTVNGVTAQGKTVTRTIPAGTMGNAQPIVSTSETWSSPDLQITVSAKHNDPRSGQSTYALTNIQRSDPPASLFQVPSDYAIKDEPARGPRGGVPPQ